MCLCVAITCLILSQNLVIVGIRIGGHHAGLLSNVLGSVLFFELLSSKKACNCKVLSNLLISCCNDCMFILFVGMEKVRPLFRTDNSLVVKIWSDKFVTMLFSNIYFNFLFELYLLRLICFVPVVILLLCGLCKCDLVKDRFLFLTVSFIGLNVCFYCVLMGESLLSIVFFVQIENSHLLYPSYLSI